jgi:acyl-CoA thioester hydrolase
VPRFRYECPLRWSDQDSYQHVNNAAFVTLFEEARARWLNSAAPGLLAGGVIVVRHEIDYLRPVTYRSQPVAIELWVTEVRAAAFTIRYELFDDTAGGGDRGGDRGGGDGDQVVACRAETRLAAYDLGASRPKRISSEYLEFLCSWSHVAEWTGR